jgi:hypothetical protein
MRKKCIACAATAPTPEMQSKAASSAAQGGIEQIEEQMPLQSGTAVSQRHVFIYMTGDGFLRIVHEKCVTESGFGASLLIET